MGDRGARDGAAAVRDDLRGVLGMGSYFNRLDVGLEMGDMVHSRVVGVGGRGSCKYGREKGRLESDSDESEEAVGTFGWCSRSNDAVGDPRSVTDSVWWAGVQR